MNVSIPGLLIICGLQGRGKSHLIHYIMHENRKKFDWGIVFSNTGFSADNFEYIDKRFIHSCQYPQAIPPVFRSNPFQVAMFNMTSKPAIEALYNSYGQMFDSYTDFKKYLLENTGDHCFVFYDARNGATSLDERYKVMKCPEKIPKFKIQPRNKIE